MKLNKAISLAWLALGSIGVCGALLADPLTLTVDAGHPGPKISPDLYGLMTEEINHAYDGGLYAELIQNRIFKDNTNKPVHWSQVQSGAGSGSITLDTNAPVNSALSTSLRLDVASASATGRVGVANDGFWGIPVKPNTKYTASFFAKGDANFSGPVTVDIESSDGATVFAQATIPGISTEWRQYTVTMTTGNVPASLTNRFVVSVQHAGTVWLNLVSLFPPTYKNRANGNRIDLMQKLADMNPSFLRLPGGNYLDPGHYQWKITIGPVSQRPGDGGAWGYRSSDGLGLLEYFEWCEDLHMQPLLAVTDGRGWLPDDGDETPLVQDALDEIEYITGSVDTPWGKKRAVDGHPAPFKLRWIEVGNEDFFGPPATYNARFAKFYDAIKAKYPNLLLIATRKDVTSRRPDIVDEHYYRSAADMEAHAHQYDSYDRSGPKIFVGEWASTEGSPTPTMQAALGDAAWMTGMERNSDQVVLASYAPLFVNVNPGSRQWGTNLIGYDALNSFGSPSYYVQKMFSNNRGDVELPVTLLKPATVVKAPEAPHGFVGVGTWKTEAEFKDIQVTSNNGTLYQSHLDQGDAEWKPGAGTWQIQDGALAQTSDNENQTSTVGSPDWTDYTYSLKAKKISGAEGFLILFHVKDSNNFIWWNIGGWGNTRSGLERSTEGAKDSIGAGSGTTVETGRWYDIRIEVQGTSIKCYLDDKLIDTATDLSVQPPQPIFAVASRETKSGDVILKVVNTSSDPQDISLNLQGAGHISKSATEESISGQPQDVNSIDNPTKVAPVQVWIKDAGSTFTQTFAPYSVSVIRLKAH